jgi:trans-aconitate methyltransferase
MEMKSPSAEEISRLQVSAANYRVRSRPDEAAVRLDSWWIEQYVKGPTILELGCADGIGTEMLLKAAASLDVVDGSPTYCELVRHHISDPRLHITNCLYEEFTPSRRYDDIVIARSLEMVVDPVAILARIHNWLGAGARLHVVVQNVASLHRRIGHALGMLAKLDSINGANALGGNRRMYTREMLIEHVRSAGLKVEFLKGYFLKPFDNATMARGLVDFTNDLIPALYEVGKSVPDELCCFYYALCVQNL